MYRREAHESARRSTEAARTAKVVSSSARKYRRIDLMRQLFNGVRGAIPKPIKNFIRERFIDAGGVDNAAFVAGSHRSGTTWAASALNFDGRYRNMYEPFNGERVMVNARFTYGLYLRPEDAAPEYAAAAENVLAGRLRHATVDQRNTRFFGTRRMIKETHANLWIAWLHRRFPSVRIVMVVRHPFATAQSRRVKGWPTRLDPFLIQQPLLYDHLAPFVDVIRAARGDFEQHVANWCVQHYVPFRQLRRDDVHVLFYEDLCVNADRALREACAFLGRPYRDSALSTLKQPSFTARRDSPIRTGAAQLVDEWQQKVSADERAAGMALLHAFGLDRVYSDDAMPLTRDPFVLPGVPR
ncbi:MAG TPA: sulfotransferase [Candidatus Eremiobacteraceae bacterium]